MIKVEAFYIAAHRSMDVYASSSIIANGLQIPIAIDGAAGRWNVPGWDLYMRIKAPEALPSFIEMIELKRAVRANPQQQKQQQKQRRL